MIDFLNLSENKSNCECLKLGYSMQLLPYKYDPYVLYVGYENYFVENVWVVNIYGEETLIFTDENESTKEYISLKNIQYNDLNDVVLKFELRKDSLGGKVIKLYSDPLKISNKNACKTTRINFKCLETDVMQSIQVPIYYVQDKRSTELENYYNIGNKTSVSYATSNAKYQVYKSKFMSIDAINKLNDALILPFVYFNYKRVTLFEAIEIPDMQADERFGETTINVSEYKGIGNNDITPVFNMIAENNDNMISENEDNMILENNN
ncbi:MAG: hypothetical protein [Caudoviricetes sp.]|nr:MAG: hypothetical protein [Caudoviricetes sp.]